MRGLIMIAAVAFATGATAQAPDARALQDEQHAAMDKLAFMDGAWRGTAVTQSARGPLTVTQTERIGPFVGGTVKVLEGRGFNADGGIGFNAFGIVSYDPRTKTYHLHSYAQGQEGEFVFNPTADGYVWDIPAGPITIRYTATFGGGKWREVGDRIAPGAPPVRFFEMNLERMGASAWPESGALTPR